MRLIEGTTVHRINHITRIHRAILRHCASGTACAPDFTPVPASRAPDASADRNRGNPRVSVHSDGMEYEDAENAGCMGLRRRM
jgi:hypothetical protein